MAAQSSNSSIATPGALLKNDWGDYPTPQDALNAFMAATTFSIEGGETGASGASGATGADNTTTYAWVLKKSIPITALVRSVNTAIDLTGCVIQIKAPAGTGTTHEQNFAVGVIENQTVHFVYNGDIADSPSTPSPSAYVLEIWELEETIPAP